MCICGTKDLTRGVGKLIESGEQEVVSSKSCRAELEVKERPVRDQLTVRAQVHLLYRESSGRWAQGGGAPPAPHRGNTNKLNIFYNKPGTWSCCWEIRWNHHFSYMRHFEIEAFKKPPFNAIWVLENIRLVLLIIVIFKTTIIHIQHWRISIV